MDYVQYWELVQGIYETTFSLFFFALALVMGVISHRGFVSKNRYGAISTLICGIIFLFFGYYQSIYGLFPWPLSGFMLWWVVFIIIVNLIFSRIIRKQIKKMRVEFKTTNLTKTHIEVKTGIRRFIIKMSKEDPYEDGEIPFKRELYRKSFHLLGLLVVAAYFGFFIIPPVMALINNGAIAFIYFTEPIYNALWGDILTYPYALGPPWDQQAIIDYTLFALVAALVIAIISDIVRTMWGPKYSVFTFATKPMLRIKEKNAAGPHVYILTGFIFSYWLHVMGWANILVVMAAILIASLSDAAAALVGRKYGKHAVKIIKGERRTLEGFIAGTVLAYFIGLLFVGPIYAIVGAVIFFLIDFFPLYISDNILNPILITVGIQVFIIILGLPVGFII